MLDAEGLDAYFAELETRPVFTRRPESIPGDYRTSWRLSVLVLLVRRGRANALSLENLHVLWWAIRSTAARELLIRWFSGKAQPDELLVRFDPSLTRTLDLGIGAGLVLAEGANIRLTALGLALAESLNGESQALKSERDFLALLPKRISKKDLQQLLEWS